MEKISQELLEGLQQAKNAMQSIQNELGLIVISEYQKQELFEAYKKNKEQIKELSVKIESEYGPGNLNIDTGEFTPSEKEAPEASVIED